MDWKRVSSAQIGSDGMGLRSQEFELLPLVLVDLTDEAPWSDCGVRKKSVLSILAHFATTNVLPVSVKGPYISAERIKTSFKLSSRACQRLPLCTTIQQALTF